MLMQVPFVHGPGDLRLNDIDAPHAGPRDVVLRVGSVGICGSDLSLIAAGGVPGASVAPVPLGHELSGTVAEVGDEVTAFAVGDRVIVNPLINMIGNGGPEGGFGAFLRIRDVTERPESLLRLPASISLDDGALVEPLAVATHAVNRLGAKVGDKVAIFGAGPIGLAAGVVLRHRGVEDVVVFDLSAVRRERARQLGARMALDPREQTPREALVELHGAVAAFRQQAPQTTHFLEASGAPVLPDVVDMARIGASICVVSTQKKPVALDFMTVMIKELTLTGALGYPKELAEVIDMLKDGAIDLKPLVSHRFAGPDVMQAFGTATQPDQAAKVLVRYEA